MTASTHTAEPADFSSQTLSGWGSKPLNLCLTVGLGGLILAVVLGVVSGGMLRVTLAYLLSLLFFLSLSLGGLFFVMIHHLTRSGWSVVVRRLAEFIACGVAPLGVLFLPIVVAVLMGSSIPFIWNDAQLVAGDPLLAGKASYLNAPFFAIRCVGYFAIWLLLSRRLLGMSLLQDGSGDPALTNKLEGLSAPGLILFALTITFAAFDWIMSLDPHWFSTIYGVYYFSGSVMSFMAVLGILSVGLQRQGLLRDAITVEHLHDIGKLMFGFMCFWAYVAMSQYLLIWYANIPEETVWFKARQEHGWQYVSLILILGHFAIPFVGFVSRYAKRNASTLVFWSALLLVMQWVDLYWLIYPNFIDKGQFQSPPIPFVELAALVGVGGVWLGGILYFVGDKPLIPLKDPRLAESLAFHNI
ncbi:quinol:cytochrome C oxidoreductase [Planctellipticum variicoloris]|uniref:quinol:cytochrome C oxidoreductase n=1 Tax=Planctellipticum variicoloris TaxID=3064265 RepID=UPI002BCA89B3|nr:quinol:cytochrome C oxidoreductase [Planctomycetaceae bacterium SH412]HTN03156.1 quinol:cytochrome C oxidoreductase [Planctomycetaceae bacterium]